MMYGANAGFRFPSERFRSPGPIPQSPQPVRILEARYDFGTTDHDPSTRWQAIDRVMANIAG